MSTHTQTENHTSSVDTLHSVYETKTVTPQVVENLVLYKLRGVFSIVGLVMITTAVGIIIVLANLINFLKTTTNMNFVSISHFPLWSIPILVVITFIPLMVFGADRLLNKLLKNK